MDAYIKKIILEEYLGGIERDLAEKAIERIEKKNPFAFIREKTTRSKEIEEKELFCDIDKAIKFLGELKKQGYTSLEQHWHSYEQNSFYANKQEDETDAEMFVRFWSVINDEIEVIEREIEEKEKKKAEIAALKKKITEIEKGL